MFGLRRRAQAIRVPEKATTSLSLRWRVMLLAMSMVAMVVVLMAVAVYAVVSAALYSDIDNQLQSRAQLLIASGSLAADPAKAIEGTAYSDVNAMLVNPGRSIYTANQQGQTLPVGQPEKAVIRGELFMSRRTVGDQRVLAIHLPNDSSLLISKSLQPTNAVMTKLKWVLLAVGGIGVVIAAVAGGMVARTGLRPVAQLTEATERVARTDDLRPIPVFGSDELARLTEAFNAMLRALAESRERQARLVADAGHELKTPLTSLRTNVELLMASSAPGAPLIPESELADLRGDVIGQIEELSTLVGDLVDLTREDNARGSVLEDVEMTEVIDRSLERVRRRRNDIRFDVDAVGWQIHGVAPPARRLLRAALGQQLRNRRTQVGHALAGVAGGEEDMRIGRRPFGDLRLRLRDDPLHVALLHLVLLGENQRVGDSGGVERVEHFLVHLHHAAPSVDQDIDAQQFRPAAKVILHQAVPRGNLGLGHSRIAVAGHVDETRALDIVGALAAQREEIELLRAAGRMRHARERLAAGQRIDERGLADIGAAGEGEFGGAAGRQVALLGRRPDEVTGAGEELAALLDVIGRVLGHQAALRPNVLARLSQSSNGTPARFMMKPCWATDRRLFQVQ